jgi:ankyrin repeat protein
MTLTMQPETESTEAESPELLEAIGRGDIKAVKELLDNGADFYEVDQVGHDALGLAIAFRNIDIVRLVIDAGADVGRASAEGITPLMSAACYNEIGIARLLLGITGRL